MQLVPVELRAPAQNLLEASTHHHHLHLLCSHSPEAWVPTTTTGSLQRLTAPSSSCPILPLLPWGPGPTCVVVG